VFCFRRRGSDGPAKTEFKGDGKRGQVRDGGDGGDDNDEMMRMMMMRMRMRMMRMMMMMKMRTIRMIMILIVRWAFANLPSMMCFNYRMMCFIPPQVQLWDVRLNAKTSVQLPVLLLTLIVLIILIILITLITLIILIIL